MKSWAPCALGRDYVAPWAKPIMTAPIMPTKIAPWAKEPLFPSQTLEPLAHQGRTLPEPAKMEPSAPRGRMLKVDEGTTQRRRAFPMAEEMDKPLPAPHAPWQVKPRRLTSASYSAVEIHGFFGLIDDGSDASGRALIVHVPKWVRGHFLDIRQGDTLHVNRADGKTGGVLTVLSTGRHKYYSPGRKVSTCTIFVSEEQWAPFAW